MQPRRACAAWTVAAALILSTAPAVALAGERSEPGPRPPEEWDDRILPLVDRVERLRGLPFEHAVPVTFLSNRRFEREFESDPGKLSRTERRELEDSAAALRALGLFHGTADELLASANEVDAEGTLAFYDSEEERIVVRGRQVDLETEVTLAHELVHALQDQHFDLDRLVDHTENASEDLALDALIEGDAVRIEQEYVAELTTSEQEEFLAARADTANEIEAGFSESIPEIIPVTFGIPYDLGPYFVLDLLAAGGNDRVDEAFDAPPITDEHVLEPATYLGEDDPEDVRHIRLADDEKRIGDPEPFGAISLYLMLASRIDAAVALDAAEGWGGDEVVQFKRDGQTCVHARFAGENPRDTDEIAGALEQWVATLPRGAAHTQRDRTITLTSCDTPDGLPAAPNSIADAEALLFNRAGLAYFLSQPPNRLEPALARCIATTVVRDPANRELLTGIELTDEQAATLGRGIESAFGECR